MQPNARLTEIPAELHGHYQLVLARNAMPLSNGCIEWVGPRNEKGYGRFTSTRLGKKRNLRAHRVAWILANGPIPDGSLVIDHLCQFPSCINPSHLELVTNEENLRRADHRAGKPPRDFASGGRAARVEERNRRRQLRKAAEFCKHGHPWAENAVIRYRNKEKGDGATSRYCLTCSRESARRTHGRGQPARSDG